MSLRGPHVFVAVIYLILAASFVASTAILMQEFQFHDWLSLALVHSHLFVFFPTFGIVVLAAFYLPSVIFTHMYWSEKAVKYGRLRFALGFVGVVGISLYVAHAIGSSNVRGVWEVGPAALASDRSETVPCTAADGHRGTCRRIPIMQTVEKIREHGRHRIGLVEFTRNCRPDPLLELPATWKERRYCFPSGTFLDTPQCCAVQAAFAARVRQLATDPATRSRSAELDAYFLPIKVFFIVVMVVIAMLLAIWRDHIDKLYPERVRAIERGIIIGGVAMLLWPLMDYAYLQTSMVMFGRMQGAIQLRWSLVIVPWAILLPFYFLRRLDRRREQIGQMASVIASAVALMRYQQINDWAVRAVGAGAEPWIFGAIVGVSLVAFVALFWRGELALQREPRRAREPAAREQRPLT